MRIAAFSDIHGNLSALEVVLADIGQHAVDHLVCLGDLVALGPFAGQVVERLSALGCPVVLGNTDAWYKEPLPAGWRPADERQAMVYDCHLWLKEQLSPEQHTYLLSLPFQQRIGPLLCVHGSPRDFREGMLPDTPEEELAAMVADVPAGIEVVLCGHTHHPMRRQVGKLTVVGVGSVGLPADGDPRPCYALLEDIPNGWQVEWPRPTYDVEAAVAAAQATGFPHLDTIAEAWRSGLGLAA